MKSKHKSELFPSQVYIRMRPAVYDGSGHDQSGAGVAKSLTSFTDTSVTLDTQYSFSKGSCDYCFTRVLEDSQQAVYSEIIPRLLTQVKHSDVLLLAYGQTGSGKTTTLFGFAGSLSSSTWCNNSTDIDLGWGVIPRLAHDLFRQFQVCHRVTIALSAIEFYQAQILDLLDTENQDIGIDAENKPAGYARIILNHPNDIIALIQQIRENRAARSTSMNLGDDVHSGSSRSHCSVMFTILQASDNDTFCETCFHVVDLAGAERPSKIGARGEASGIVAAYKLLKGESISAEEEGLLINYSLFEFCKEVKIATELHKRGKRYQQPRQGTLPLTKYLGRCIDGRALASMIVCLSQAPQCGWETWFSLKYGTDLVALQTPVRKSKARSIQKTRLYYQDALEKAKETLVRYEKAHCSSTSANSKRWLQLKRIDVAEVTMRVNLLETLTMP